MGWCVSYTHTAGSGRTLVLCPPLPRSGVHMQWITMLTVQQVRKVSEGGRGDWNYTRKNVNKIHNPPRILPLKWK